MARVHPGIEDGDGLVTHVAQKPPQAGSGGSFGLIVGELLLVELIEAIE